MWKTLHAWRWLEDRTAHIELSIGLDTRAANEPHNFLVFHWHPEQRLGEDKYSFRYFYNVKYGVLVMAMKLIEEKMQSHLLFFVDLIIVWYFDDSIFDIVCTSILMPSLLIMIVDRRCIRSEKLRSRTNRFEVPCCWIRKTITFTIEFTFQVFPSSFHTCCSTGQMCSKGDVREAARIHSVDFPSTETRIC